MTAEEKQLREKVSYLSDKNNDAFKALHKMGVQINPAGILEARLEMLITHLIPEPIERLKFEVEWHEHVKQVLDNTREDAERQRNKKRLHVPGQ
jgi:hypothetical protein